MLGRFPGRAASVASWCWSHFVSLRCCGCKHRGVTGTLSFILLWNDTLHLPNSHQVLLIRGSIKLLALCAEVNNALNFLTILELFCCYSAHRTKAETDTLVWSDTLVKRSKVTYRRTLDKLFSEERAYLERCVCAEGFTLSSSWVSPHDSLRSWTRLKA